MDNEIKWVSLIMLFILGIPMVGLALEQYNRGQCRIEAIRANMPAEQIEKVCK